METKEMTKEEALSKFLDCDTEEAEKYIEDGDYLVLTDEEADEAVDENIKDSLWAFNASFIISECGLNFTKEESIQKMQQSQCESCNEIIRTIIDGSCGIGEFVRSAVSSDGRGNFLSGYDGEENEEGKFFIYRIN